MFEVDDIVCISGTKRGSPTIVGMSFGYVMQRISSQLRNTRQSF